MTTCAVHELEVDVVVQDDSTVLLVRPQTPPDGAEGWRLPGDALQFGEAPEGCARRVLKERLGLDPEGITLAEVESMVENGVWRLVFHFRCGADRRPTPSADLAEVRFFQLEHLPAMAGGPRAREAIYRIILV